MLPLRSLTVAFLRPSILASFTSIWHGVPIPNKELYKRRSVSNAKTRGNTYKHFCFLENYNINNLKNSIIRGLPFEFCKKLLEIWNNSLRWIFIFDRYICNIEWLPNAKSVFFFGDFNNWDRKQLPFIKDEFGFWHLYIRKEGIFFFCLEKNLWILP